MFLKHCYAFGLLLKPYGLKKKFFGEGNPPGPILAPPWIHPWADLAQEVIQMCGVMSTLSLPSLVNIHQAIL